MPRATHRTPLCLLIFSSQHTSPTHHIRAPAHSQPNVTIPPTMAAAVAGEVLHLPELLETILLYLPIRHLLTATRVCKTWHNNIQASHKLRRALFLQSLPGDPIEFSHKRHDLSGLNDVQSQNLLLQHYKEVVYQLPPSNPKVAESWEYMWNSPSPAPRQPVPFIINPLVDIFLTIFGIHFETLSNPTDPTTSRAGHRPEASCDECF